MKKLLLIFCFSALIVLGQNQFHNPDYFFGKDSTCFGTPGDSISNCNNFSLNKYLYLSYQCSTTGGDSLSVEAYNKDLSVWFTVAVRTVNSDSLFTTIYQTGASTKRLYLVNVVRPYQVRVTLINYRLAVPTRKGYLSWVGKND
jgi:hypothetical protein